MTQLNLNKHVPETLNFDTQKRLMPNPSDIGPKNTLNEIFVTDTTSNDIVEQTQEALVALSDLDTLENSTITQNHVTNDLHNESSTKLIDQELYVTNFSNKTTCDDLKQYISRYGDFDFNKMKIIRLTKKDQDVSRLSFVSFKIETTDTIAKQLMQPGFWPMRSDIKKFVNKET